MDTPTIKVGHPHPHTGMEVQWPIEVPENWKQSRFNELLNRCPKKDIKPLKKEIATLHAGSWIKFAHKGNIYQCQFESAQHKWHGSTIDVVNVTLHTGKKMKHEKGVRLSKINHFSIL